MREIKFRAWNVLAGVITSLSSLTLPIQTKNGNVHLMQFTGLLDKNGVEIWEGDIVKEDDEIGFVKYGDGMFYAFSYAFEHSELSKDLEIIGNIYENPEQMVSK